MTPKLKGTCPLFTKCALNTLAFHLNPYRPTFLSIQESSYKTPKPLNPSTPKPLNPSTPKRKNPRKNPYSKTLKTLKSFGRGRHAE